MSAEKLHRLEAEAEVAYAGWWKRLEPVSWLRRHLAAGAAREH